MNYNEIKKTLVNLEEYDGMLEAPNYQSMIRFFEPNNTGVHFEITVLKPEDKKVDIALVTGIEKCLCEPTHILNTYNWYDKMTYVEQVYVTNISYDVMKEFIALEMKIEGIINETIDLDFGGYTPFARKVAHYLKLDNKLLFLDDCNSKTPKIIVTPYDKKTESKLKRMRTKSLLAWGKIGCKAILARSAYEKKKAKLTKGIWLISDRTVRGDDNGEVMFRYMCANPDPTVEPFFVVNQNTTDYVEMGKLGKVVEAFSWKHKTLFLLSEVSLSSQANNAVINPFGRLECLYRDIIYDRKFVFLQHGVTKDNQSKWLNRFNRNILGFVVSTKPEYDSIFEYDYYYDKSRVWLTGMPRYDRLIHDEKKWVTIMPTWRKTLSAGADARGVWKLGEDFAVSDYFKFYNDLINNKKLLDRAQELGYTICFMPHPNTIDGIHMFDHDERVMFMDTTYSYKDVFAQTNLMVTDYSSVAFDFAYLRKPIIYSQFDKEEFFGGGHSYTQGYFDYERDGFGEVTYTLDETIEKIILSMENDCKLNDKYKQRIDETFAFDDQNCAKRVYEMVIKSIK